MQNKYFWIVKILDLYGDDSTQFADWGAIQLFCQLTAACVYADITCKIQVCKLRNPFHHSLSLHWKALYGLLYCPVRVDFALDLKVLSSEMDPVEIRLIRQFLRNLQTRGAFIAAFYKWKTMDDNQKSLLGAIGHW